VYLVAAGAHVEPGLARAAAEPPLRARKLFLATFGRPRTLLQLSIVLLLLVHEPDNSMEHVVCRLPRKVLEAYKVLGLSRGARRVH
jgi:hypothetical protein|tara:strand:- start:330 stop:587 length:258 start_codon:yes stop_codon:yes gene_type:complete